MPEAEDDIVDNIVRRFQSQENGYINRSLEQDKNKAAQSIKLGNETGEDPQRILNEYDRIYAKSKGDAAKDIVDQEPWLRQYIRENPIHATVSQDDWGALSEYTQKIREFNQYIDDSVPWVMRHGVQGLPFMVMRGLPETIENIKGGIKGISDFAERTWGKQDAYKEEIEGAKKSQEELEQASRGRGVDFENSIWGMKMPQFNLRTMRFEGWTTDTQKKLEEQTAKSWSHPELANLLFSALQLDPRILPIISLFQSEISIPIEKAGGPPREVTEGLALLAAGTYGIKHIQEQQIKAGEREAAEAPLRKLRQVLDKAERTFERAELWAKTGERPPIGADPVLDQLIGLESTNRMTALDAVIDFANKTEGKELSPEAFAELNKIGFKDKGSIFLRWDMARSLYGDKLPEPGDKLLGDVPRVAEQFERSRDFTGEPIEIPIELLPGLEKEFYELIKDDLFFEGGMDRRTAKEIMKQEPELSTIHEQEMPGLSQDLRREFTLKVGDEGLHHVIDEQGQKVGEIRVTEQDGGKNLFISWEKGQYDTAGLITLMQHLKQRYPNAETISTVKVPGVRSLERALQGSDIAVDMPFRIKERPVDVVRRAAGLDPLFDLPDEIGPRSLKLVPGKAPDMYQGYGGIPWTITDEAGRPVGSLEIELREKGKEIYIGWIGSSKTLRDVESFSLMGRRGLLNKLGPTLVRSLIRQLKEAYPEAEVISGTRISGAREKRELAREAREQAEGKVISFWSGDRIRIKIKDLMDEAENMPAGWHPDEIKGMGPETRRLAQLLMDLEGYEHLGGGRYALEGAPFTAEEIQLERSIDKFLRKVAGKDVDVIKKGALRSITSRGVREIGGFFRFYTYRRPFIMWSLEAPDPYLTAGHEAIHFLQHYRFIRPEEWQTLKKAAEEHGWLDTPAMKRYEHLRKDYPELYYEEAIADEFKKWAKLDREQQQLHGAAKIFQKIKDLVEAVKSAYREWSGKEPTADQIMRDIQSGRVARRRPMGVSMERAKAFGLPEHAYDTPGMYADLMDEKPPPIEEKVPTFAPGAIMDKKKYAQYQRHLNEQNANDVRIERENALKEIKRRDAPEWKANRETMRGEVANEIGARPDFRARAFFQNGTFFGQDTHYLPKVSPRFLTKEQREKFPARWQERGGLDPDTLAQPFGYQTGAQLIDAMIKFEQEKGKLTPKDFFERVVNKETDRRMELKYGDRSKQNLEEAQEQALGHIQLELLKEEAIALGERAGMKISLSKQDVKSLAATAFNDSMQIKANHKYYMGEMYRTGKAAESAFLVGDYIKAFQEKWMQVHLFEQAREIKRLDMQRAKVERVAKRFYKRYPDNFPAEFTEFIQKILMNAGFKVDRHPDDLQMMFDAREHKGDLRRFVDDLNELRAGEEKFEASLDPYLIIPDFILDNWPNWKKTPKEMTVGEYRAFHDALSSLQKIGADQGKLHRLGEEADLQKELAIGRKQLTQIGPEKMPTKPGKKANLAKLYHVGTIRPEDLLIRMDKGNEDGFFTKFITDPLNDRAYFFDMNHREFRQARIDNDKKYGATTTRQVENDIFYDPRYFVKSVLTGKMERDPRGFGKLPLTHEHVRGVLLNWGNKSNRERITEGYQVTEAEVEAWLKKVATEDDWRWAESVGRMYDKLLEMSHEVTMRESNTMVEALPLPSIDTPHGKMDGWYYPVHYDKAMDGGVKNSMKLSPVKNTRTYRGWERKRVGPAGPIELHLNSLDLDMNKRIHDLAFREVLRDMRKILGDTGMRNDITKRMGRHYYDMLKQLHNDIAQPYAPDSGALAAANKYSEFFRQNTIMMLVGMKIGTFMKHVPSTFVQSWGRLGFTKMDFWSSTADLVGKDDLTNTNNWKFIVNGPDSGKVGEVEYTGSREIKKRWRHYAAAHGVDTMAMKAKSFREFMMQASSVPIAAGDMMSSVILYNGLYKKLRAQYMKEGMTLEEAHTKADIRADFAIRQTHGSTSLVSRPEIMRRTGSAARWFTSLYSYYNHVYGQLYRMMWRSKDFISERNRGLKPTQDFMEYSSEMANLFTAYVALPAGFYWLAQDFLLGKEDDEDESLAYKIAAPVIHNIGGAFWGVRDVIGLATGGGQMPAPGLIGVPLQRAWQMAMDVKRWADPDKGWKEDDPGKAIQHATSLLGVATGLSSEQQGMWFRFIHNYMQAVEEPEGMADFYRGLRRGTIERRKR